MRRLNSKTAMDKIDRHTLECLHHGYDEWEDLPEHELLVAFWQDYKTRVYRYGDQDPYRRENLWRYPKVWLDFLQGLPYAFSWESYEQTLLFADWLCENETEKKAYMKKWWEDKDDPDPWEAYAGQVWNSLWRLSRRNKIDPVTVPDGIKRGADHD